MKKNADVNAQTIDGDTPLHLAEDIKIIEMLIKYKADVNKVNNHKDTPLHLGELKLFKYSNFY